MPPKRSARAAASSTSPDPIEDVAVVVDAVHVTNSEFIVDVKIRPVKPWAATMIPDSLHFPLIVVFSLAMQGITSGLFEGYLGPELGSISRVYHQEWQVMGLVGWKVLELYIAWFARFDGIDFASFTLLTHLPHAYLLHTFYAIPLLPSLFNLALTISIHYTALYIFRANKPAKSPASAAADPTLSLTTLLLGSTLYTLPLLLSLSTWLPTYLAIHFDGLRTLAPAHSANLPLLILSLLPAGFAARKFLFTPFVDPTTRGSADAKPTPRFDAAAATLTETLMYNLQNVTHPFAAMRPHAAVLLQQTALLATWTTLNTAFLAWATVEGCDAAGSMGWGSVWGIGAMSCGLGLGWVGAVF